jgi:acetyl esterase/lipase
MPIPTSVGPEAQAYLKVVGSAYGGASAPPPALGDAQAWRDRAAAADAATKPFLQAMAAPAESYTRSEFDVAGVTVYTLTPTALESPDSSPIFIDIHGGGLLMGGGELAWLTATAAAVGREGVTWAPDYRMPPDHPFPAGLDDLVAVYRHALSVRAPEQIIVEGASAGGNLAAALLLRVKAENLPMPAALVLMTPEVDLTESGDSFALTAGLPMSASLMQTNLLYANGHSLEDPFVSPLFGDLEGFPPTFLFAGTRDFFLSNTARMHRRLLAAGVPAELHVFEAMPHGGFGGTTPEDKEVRDAVQRFERAHLNH